jgi:hypothetical protein
VHLDEQAPRALKTFFRDDDTLRPRRRGIGRLGVVIAAGK